MLVIQSHSSACPVHTRYLQGSQMRAVGSRDSRLQVPLSPCLQTQGCQHSSPLWASLGTASKLPVYLNNSSGVRQQLYQALGNSSAQNPGAPWFELQGDEAVVGQIVGSGTALQVAQTC